MSFYTYFWIGLLVSITACLIHLKVSKAKGIENSRPVVLFQFISMILAWPLIVAYIIYIISNQIKLLLQFEINIRRKFWTLKIMKLAYRICPQDHKPLIMRYLHDYSKYIIADFDKKTASIDAKSKT